MRIEIRPAAAFSEAERAEMKALSTAVYPPGDPSTSAIAGIEWAPQTIRALIRDDGLVAHVGAVVRDAVLNGRPVRIGGIGGVMTLPAARNRGHIRAGIEQMREHLVDVERVAFLLLFCADRLVPFYGKLGWRLFAAPPAVEQHGKRVSFTYNNPMVRDGTAPAPTAGRLDLLGPPW